MRFRDRLAEPRRIDVLEPRPAILIDAGPFEGGESRGGASARSRHLGIDPDHTRGNRSAGFGCEGLGEIDGQRHSSVDLSRASLRLRTDLELYVLSVRILAGDREPNLIAIYRDADLRSAHHKAFEHFESRRLEPELASEPAREGR